EVNVTEIQDIDVPEPGPGEVLIEADYSLISPGTERSRLINRGGGHHYPFRPGYSLAGHIMALGPDVEGLAVGQAVISDAPHAAHVKMAANRVMAVPDGVDQKSAAFHRVGMVALHGAHRSRIEVGESVAVIGQGLVGLLALQMARLQGAVPLIALDL